MEVSVQCIVQSNLCNTTNFYKNTQIGFQDQVSLNEGQKYCRMLQGEHSAILSTFIKLPFVIKIFVLSIFDWLFYTGFTGLSTLYHEPLFSCQSSNVMSLLIWIHHADESHEAS